MILNIYSLLFFYFYLSGTRFVLNNSIKRIAETDEYRSIFTASHFGPTVLKKHDYNNFKEPKKVEWIDGDTSLSICEFDTVRTLI